MVSPLTPQQGIPLSKNTIKKVPHIASQQGYPDQGAAMDPAQTRLHSDVIVPKGLRLIYVLSGINAKLKAI